MPFIKDSDYRPPFYLRNGHLATIIPSLWGAAEEPIFTRERIDTPDGDFLDIDWVTQDADKLLVLSHGLEGSSDRYYIKRMAQYFYERGWDIMAWNCRSCSGEINRLPIFYHHGATDDLDLVLQHSINKYQYRKVAMAGFSMGGSLTVKYLGERGSQLKPPIIGAAVFSVPCDLAGSSQELEKPHNRIYFNRFMKKLRKKIIAKHALYPDQFDIERLPKIKTFSEFDDVYTAPLHGFKDSKDFYAQCSSGQFLDGVRVPLLLVNAWNDPFLPQTCYPFELAAGHDKVYLEVPRLGGHVGFTPAGGGPNWMNTRAFEFLDPLL